MLEKIAEQRDNATSLLYEAKGELSGLSNFKDIDECRERLESAYYEVRDVADVLESIKQNTDFDPKELERIDARLDLIKSLSKKYGRTVEDILAYQEKCQKRLEELRLKNGIQTVYELSQRTHIHRNNIAQWIKKSYLPSIDDLSIIANLFDISIDYLIGRTDDDTSYNH